MDAMLLIDLALKTSPQTLFCNLIEAQSVLYIVSQQYRPKAAQTGNTEEVIRWCPRWANNRISTWHSMANWF